MIPELIPEYWKGNLYEQWEEYRARPRKFFIAALITYVIVSLVVVIFRDWFSGYEIPAVIALILSASVAVFTFWRLSQADEKFTNEAIRVNTILALMNKQAESKDLTFPDRPLYPNYLGVSPQSPPESSDPKH